MTSSKNVMLLLAQLLLLAVATSQAAELKVGIVSMLASTNSAGVPVAWIDILKAFHIMYVLAAKHFNDRNPVFVPKFGELGSCNKTIQMATGVMLDDNGKTAGTVRAFLNAYNAGTGLDVVVGGLTSTATVPLSIASNAFSIPVIGARASTAALSDKVVHPMFARTASSAVSVAGAMALALDQWGLKHVGIIYGEDEFGTSWKNALYAALDKRGIRLTSVPVHSTLEGDDLRESVDNAVRIMSTYRFNVMVYMVLSTTTYSHLAVSVAKRNLTAADGKLWIISEYDQRFPSTLANFTYVRKFLQGALSFDATIPGQKNSISNPRWKEMTSYFSNNISTDDVNWAFPTYLINNTSYLIPNDAWFATVANTIENAWAFAYDAVAAAGLAACASGGDNVIPTTAQLYKNILNVTFDGLSGKVKFTPSGDRDESGIVFTISNWAVDGSGNMLKYMVGEYITSYANWEISESILFPSNTSTPPLDVTPPYHDQNLLPLWAKVIGYAEVSVICLVVIMCAGFLMLNAKDKIIVNSQPVFMKSLLFGIALAGGSIVPLTMDGPTVENVGDGACMAFPWAIGIGLTIAVVSLMAKSYRISIIFNNSKFRKITAPASRFFMVVLIVTAIEAALLIAWTVVAPLRYSRILQFINEFGQPVSSYGICLGPAPASGAFVGCLCTLHALLIIITMRITQQLSRVPAKFQETRWVNIAALSTGQVYLIGLPSAAAVYGSPLGRFLVLSTVVFLSCLALLIAMFYPKYMMRHYGEDYFISSEGSSLHVDNPKYINNNTVDSSRNSKGVNDSAVRLGTMSNIFSVGSVNSKVDVGDQA